MAGNVESAKRGAEAARETLQEAADGLQDQVEPVLADLDQRARQLVSDHPIATLLGAVAAGYLAGRVLARR